MAVQTPLTFPARAQKVIELLNRSLGLRKKFHLTMSRIGSYDEYLKYRDRTAEGQEPRLQTERDLATSKSSFTVPGYCFVCRKNAELQVDYP